MRHGLVVKHLLTQATLLVCRYRIWADRLLCLNQASCRMTLFLDAARQEAAVPTSQQEQMSSLRQVSTLTSVAVLSLHAHCSMLVAGHLPQGRHTPSKVSAFWGKGPDTYAHSVSKETPLHG